MHSHNYDSIVEAQAGVRQKGFTEEFLWKDGEMLSEDKSMQYDATDLTVVEHYRFEGMSNPADMSIMMLLESKDGRKGYVISSYGPTADEKLTKFLDDVPQREDTEVHKAP